MFITCPKCGGRMAITREGWQCFNCGADIGAKAICHLLPEMRKKVKAAR